MSDLPAQSILCPILIGRDLGVAALSRLLDQVHTGHGQIALISGEAGIGKSRLLAELSAQASQQGFLILVGRCFETDRAFPYAPVADLLRTYQSRQAAAGEGCGRPGLEALFPELAVESAAPPANVGVAAEQEKRRIFQRVVDFLHQQTNQPATGQAQRQPLLVIFEDLP